MKKLIGLLGVLFLATSMFAQTNPVKIADTTKVFLRDKYADKKPLYVINERVGDSIKDINPNDILSINILKDVGATALYGEKAKNGAIIIVTKEFAVKKYQEKFSAFSKKYKGFLSRYKIDDTDFLYILNGIPLDNKSTNRIKVLFEIPDNALLSINCMSPFANGMDNKQPLIIITSKQ
ncbi:TonB-dependent SusC/RagA subfamily outer membrane receptor [Mucilaginibacter frigoritolerans]|uniref:TonB-dependent SusC/RagA subfamily outer membrane receptor n=1 Tax=Mucilaginibacter frigoritolerans TaxID=652788 RepID=A0A562U9M6_9SPHI|nr:TonB-dependent receptor plug domain-containing protein [Mucilaginibacter frigoritolerans]TWJ02526.1 TonB-dependent SusC/RagA subfamily outer membrane receptor [Mucilaginibacter frigoritolerans]